jgi:SAM-dependent methyltransferase
VETERAVTDHLGVETLEIRKPDLIEMWQDFQISTMPDMISAMNLCHVVHALASTPLLARIRNGQNDSANGLFSGMDRAVSEQMLRYLVLRGVLEEWHGSYVLTRKGAMLTSEIALARLGFYVEAYGPVLRKIPDLMRGDAVYGVDVERDGGPLSRHSGTIFAKYYTPVVLAAMHAGNAKQILDLGCGSGRLLLDACLQDPDITGVGLDIAPDAIEFARELAREHGLEERLSFVVADAFDPAGWPDVCKQADLISAVGVLHEHLRDGQDAVVRILDAYATMLRGDRMMLIGEPEPHFDDKENDSDFLLVHMLTAQGLPAARDVWLDIFDRSRLTCRRILTRATAGPRTCFYELVAPR